MKAITLHQPWATWIALGWKTIETRTHNRLASLKGQRIAIHAGKTFSSDAFSVATPYMASGRMEQARQGEYPVGKVVCTAMVAEARRLNGKDSKAALCYCSGGDLYGLVLTDIRPHDRPLPAAGHQGIWQWDPPEADPTKGNLMAKTAKKKEKKKEKKTDNKPSPEAVTKGGMAADDLRRVFGEHQVVEERAETLLDAQDALKQAKADYAEAFDRLDKLLIECDVDRGREVISARADVRDRAKAFEKASDAVKQAKAGLKEAWGVINDLIDEKIDGLPLIDGAGEDAA